MNEITQDLVKKLFDYRDGDLYWKVYKSSRAKIGDLAGTAHHNGYRQIQIDGKIYLVHRLIFLYGHGYLPKGLDHIDGNKLNNDILNLREATNQENHFNERKTKTYGGKPTSSQYKGVSWNKRAKKWQSHITIDGKLKNLGSFDLEIEAAKAYNTAAMELFGEFKCLNIIDKVSNGLNGFDSQRYNTRKW